MIKFLYGSGFAFFLLVVFKIMISNYPSFKEFVSDVYHLLNKLFFGVFRFFRKKSVEYKYTSYIDRLRSRFNDSSMSDMLPKCKVRWISPNQKEGLFKENNHAIVCMHLDKNYDANVFNALQYFVTKELLPNTDPYMDKNTLFAIRMMCLRVIVITKYKLLSMFNKLFVNQTEDVKSVIRKMDEMERCGLFNKILLPCLSIWSDKILTQLPTENHKSEADMLIEWLYYNAKVNTKDDERFQFKCVTKNIKLALIVVANDEYFEERSFWPYIRRAHTYSSKHYDVIHLLALGKPQGERARKLCDILTKDSCFTILSKQSQTYVDDLIHPDRKLLTCIALKPNYDVLIDRAWGKLSELYKSQSKVRVFISDVHATGLTVNFEGLLLDVYIDNLTSMKHLNHYLYFQKHDVLDLGFIHFDNIKRTVSLTNVGSETDPSHIIEQFKGRINEQIAGSVLRINTYDGVETGLLVDLDDCELDGFVSRHNVTRATYTKISDFVKVGDSISMSIINYDIEHKRYVCRLADIYDPLQKECPTVGSIYDLQVMSVCESGVSCKLFNGLEGFIPLSLFSWFDKSKNREDIFNLKIGAFLQAKLMSIDHEKQKLQFSRKDSMQNVIEMYVKANKGMTIKGAVEVETNKYLYVRLPEGHLVFVPLRKNDRANFDGSASHIGEMVNIKIDKYDDTYQNCVGFIAAS